MVENILVTVLGSYIFASIIFIISLYIARYLNSPHIFQFISITSSISIIFIFVSLKLQSSWFIHNQLLTFAFSGYSIILSFKFLELAFGYKWTYTRQMPLKLVVMYLYALPQMPESEAKLSELSRQDVRRENILSILRGICELIILQTLFYLIPFEWFSLSPSASPFIFHFLRCGLLSIILYFSIAFATDFGFGIYGLLLNLRMNSVFPLFPFTSTSLREFWSYRWNKLVQISLHLISFVVIPKLIDPIIPMNTKTKGILAFALSGFIHEYVLWFVSDKWSGKNILFFMIHGLLVLLEIIIKLPAKPNTLKGKLMGWMWTTGIMLITSPLFFDPFIERGFFFNMK